jgi:hypothetical protein
MRQRWEDWINLVLGAWLFFSPWIMNYTTATTSAWNAWIIGAAFVIFTVWALSAPKPWEEWFNTVLSIWLIISPWVIGLVSQAITWNFVIVGLIVLAISLDATRPSRQMTVA